MAGGFHLTLITLKMGRCSRNSMSSNAYEILNQSLTSVRQITGHDRFH